MSTESDRKTVTIPAELWAKVRIRKIERGDEFLSDVVVRALKFYFGPHGPKQEVKAV